MIYHTILISIYEISTLINAGQSFMKRWSPAAKILMIQNTSMIGKEKDQPMVVSAKRTKILAQPLEVKSPQRNRTETSMSCFIQTDFGSNLCLRSSGFLSIGIKWGPP